MSKFMKKFLSVLCCLMIVFSSYSTVFAEDYKKYDSSDDSNTDSEATYYIIESQDFNKLFDFGISDVQNLFDWVWDMKTYTVIKKYKDENGDYVVKGYFNTPNLQQLVKNQVVQNLNDGYTDNAYDVEETEWLVPVGYDTGKANVITRYGFNVPSYLYNGEYPTEIMTIAGVIPTGFWDTLWRAITSLFGASFIKAPDASNFNTITYMNHGYVDKEDYLVELIRQYYIPYFVARIAQDKYDDESELAYCKDYFTSTDEFIKETVTDEENLAAERYITENFELYKKIKRTENGYNLWNAASKNNSATNRFGVSAVPNAWKDAKDSDYKKYLGNSTDSDGLDIPCAHSNKGTGSPYHEKTKYGEQGLYADFSGWILNNEDFTQAVKDWYAIKPEENANAHAAALQGIILNNSTLKSKYSDMPDWGLDGTAVYNYFNDILSDDTKFADFIMNVLNKDKPTPKLYYRYYYAEQVSGNTEEAKKRAGKEYEDIEISAWDANYASATIDVKNTILDIQNPSNAKDIAEKTKEKNNAWSDYKSALNVYNAAVRKAQELVKDSSATQEQKDEQAKVVEEAEKKKNEAYNKWSKIKIPEAEYKNKIPDKYLTITDRTYTHLFYKDNKDTAVFISYTDLESFYEVTLPYFDFDADKWINKRYARKRDDYDKAVKKTNDYDDFIKKVNLINKEDGFTPDKDKMTGIAYSQCLITNTGKDGECKNNRYGSEASITVGSLYAYNGLYHLTPGFSYKEYLNGKNADYLKTGTNDANAGGMIYETYDTLTTEQAHKIVNFIKNSAGPYYAEVMGNIVKLIVLNATEEGDRDPEKLMNKDDVRVMPYDVTTLTKSDAENYSVADPRVEKYKETVIGSFVANFSMSFFVNWNGIFKMVAPQKTLLSIIGKVTEFSVFMQQICNFDKFDEFGLSPATMWSSDTGFGLLLMGSLALFFIFKTIKSVIELCKYGKCSSGRIFAAFLFLILELGLITAISAAPERTWNVVKKVDTAVINAGEMGTFFSDKDMKYLFGDEGSLEVTYYLPYLDAWSKYNTGYGILDEKQKINYDENKDKLPELKNFENPKMGSQDIGHWSVLLMDSFEYHGKSTSAYWSAPYDNPMTNQEEYVNGVTINNNAYRVVDHFMAPRITITESGDKMKLSTTENENYNGEFQEGVADLFVKLLLALFICFLSLLKLLIFLWQWYMFYIFFFEAILGKLAERKSWKQIFLQTFAPTIALVLLGAYVGLALMIGMSVEGFFGMVLIILLFLLTFYFIGWWYRLAAGQYFPGTLKPIYSLYTMLFAGALSFGGGHKGTQLSHQDALKIDDDIKAHFSEEDDDFKSAFMYGGALSSKMNILWDEQGNLKKNKFHNRKYDRIKGNAIDMYEREHALGKTTMEQDNFFAMLKEKDPVAYENYKAAFSSKYGINSNFTKGNVNNEAGKKNADSSGVDGKPAISDKSDSTSSAEGSKTETTSEKTSSETKTDSG